MNIALFTDTYLPAKNGIVTHIKQLAGGLRRHGHTVYIVAPRISDYRMDDPDVLQLPAFHVPFLGQGMEIWYTMGPQAMVNQFLKDKKIDIVHTHTEFALGRAGRKAAMKFGCPVVHTLHTMWEEYRHYIMKGKVLTRNMVRRLAVSVLKDYDGCIAPSGKSVEWIQGILPTMPVTVISNGIDETQLLSLLPAGDRQERIRAGLGIGPDDVVLIFVGRLGREKRVMELFDAVLAASRADPRIRMIFVGDGPELAPMRAKAAAAGAAGTFLFTGFIPWEEVIRLYAIANLCVTLSLSEVQPMVLIEALMCGLPVVARKDLAYAGLVVDGVNGYLVDGDAGAQEAVLNLARDPALLGRMVRESRARSREFYVENTAKRMAALYADVLRDYNRRHPS